MYAVEQFGTWYYLLRDGKRVARLTYPQYRVLLDIDAGYIRPEQAEERLAYYVAKQEIVQCPLCEKSTTRGMAELLASPGDHDLLHECLMHDI